MPPTIDRRQFLKRAGVGGLAVVIGPTLWQQASAAAAPAVEQVHLQFGANAAHQMSVSWATAASVSRPRVRYGTAAGGLGSTVEAVTQTYVDPLTKRIVTTHHGTLEALHPSTDYVYEALHNGAAPVMGTFRTGPSGRAAFPLHEFRRSGSERPPTGIGGFEHGG